MRCVLVASGVLTLAVLWLGPFPELAKEEFWAHMTLHMGVVAVAAPLLSLSVAGSRYDPVFKLPRVFAPIPASVIELIVVWAWHAPGLHHFARHEVMGLLAEQSMFLVCGVWVWLSAFGGDAWRGGSRAGAGIVGLLLTSMHMTLLGALLALSPRPLYRHGDAVPMSSISTVLVSASGEEIPLDLGRSTLNPNAALCLSPNVDFVAAPRLTPLEDQHLGGAVMLLVGGASYLLGGLWLTVSLLQMKSLSRGESS